MFSAHSVAPQLEQYLQYVEQFVRLDIRSPNDRLNAFQGLPSHLRPEIGEFIAGLPILSSLCCLLWRKWSDEEQAPRVGKLPIWSWLGWSDKVSYLGAIRSDLGVQIHKIRGSKTPESRSKRLLWLPRGNVPSEPDEPMAVVPLGSIKALHFEANTVDSTSNAIGLPELPHGHVFALMALGEYEMVDVLQTKPDDDDDDGG